MKRIRILLSGTSTLLLDSLHHIVESMPDMAVVGRVGARGSLQAARRTRANVVVVEQGNANDAEEIAYRLLERLGLKVLTIDEDGKTGTLYELRPHRLPLGEMSADTLRTAIRGTRARPIDQH